MKWYQKYLAAYERPYTEVPEGVKQEVARKLKKFSHVEEPVISVVAIAHNEGRHILACLWSLADNAVDLPTEIIVVSNHSTDDTDTILSELGVTWYSETRKSPGFARQCGLDHARGTYHICIDSDTLYPPHYIATHVRCLQQKDVVCTYGLWSFLPDKNHSATGLFFYELLRDIYLNVQNFNRPELCVRGMVLAFRTAPGKKVGYRTNIIRGEDGMMALGLKKYGKLKFLRTSKVRAITSNQILNSGGGLMKSAWFRFKKGIGSLQLLFTKQEEYKDQDYNLIDKKPIS